MLRGRRKAEKEKEENTRPSIYSIVTHQMSRKKRNHPVGTVLQMMELGQQKAVEVDATGSVGGGTGWYLMVLGQYNLVLFGIKWNWVKYKAFMPVVHILKKVEIWSDVTIAGQTNKQGKIELVSQWTMDG